MISWFLSQICYSKKKRSLKSAVICKRFQKNTKKLRVLNAGFIWKSFQPTGKRGPSLWVPMIGFFPDIPERFRSVPERSRLPGKRVPSSPLLSPSLLKSLVYLFALNRSFMSFL
jgi:hypothetical protein